MLVTYFFGDLLPPDLDLLNMTFILVNNLSYTSKSTLGEFELFAVRLIDSRAQNMKTVFLTFDLTLTWQLARHDILKC